MKTVKPTPLLHFADIAPGREIVTVSVGPQNDVIVLSRESRADVSPTAPYRYRIHHQTNQWLNVVNLPETEETIDFVQPVGTHAWLLVRSQAKRDADLNAHLYSSEGRYLHSFHAGDGIADVQTTSDGQIWVSYFDEGCYNDQKFGQAGLVCFREDGQATFRYNSELISIPSGIDDCYALNVAYKDEVWLYYWQAFPLVRLRRKQVDRVWKEMPVKGAHAFAVRRDLALFAGGYDEHDKLFLISLETMVREEVLPLTADGEPLAFDDATGRSFRLYLCDSQTLYLLDLNDLAL